MLFFAAPWLMGFLPVIGVAGLWALWRGKHGQQAVSSTRLWQGLTEAAAGRKRRRVDPVWLLIFLAALLAALALAGPGWRVGGDLGDAPSAKVAWSVRSVGNGPPELFLRVSEGRNLGDRLEVEFARGDAQPWPEHATTAGTSVPLADGWKGVVVDLSIMQGERKFSLRLHSQGEVIAVATFTRPGRTPFGLLTRTGPGRRIDPALERVFKVNPAARRGDALVHPAVLLVDDPGFTLEGLDERTLVIGSPETPLPGVKIGATFAPVGAKPKAVSLPAFVRLENVGVRWARLATLSPEWTVEATVDGHPWLATRRAPGHGPILMWMGSDPVAETNWPLESSFVVYFSNLLERAFPRLAGGGMGSGDGQILDWARRDRAAEVAKGPGREVRFSSWIGAAAIGLLAAGAGLLARRGRGV